MPSFLKDISAFYGTGEKNASGETLEEFLENYDPGRYERPCCTTDAAVFSYCEGKEDILKDMKILLVRRSNHPSIGFWALPGGFANMQEDLDETAKRELEEETGVKGIAAEQFACYGDYDRDPRARVITTAYLSLVREESVSVKAGDDAADAAWCPVRIEKCSSSETKERAEDNGEWIREEYLLQIENRERGFSTEARVERRVRKGLIREQKFTVKERGMIAVDHAAIIVQAMLILSDRVKEKKPL